MFRITTLSSEYFISDSWDIARNSLVKSFQHWGDVFSVDFAIGVTKLPSVNWTNVFHFTVNGDNADYGDRIPALWIHKDGYFRISFNINDNQYYHKDFEFVLGQKYHIILKQFIEGEKYWYEVKINGESKYHTENTQPQIYDDVKLYASDPWYEPFSSDLGQICNVKIQDF